MVVGGEAYPLNGASKNITPSLKWPRDAYSPTWQKTGIDPYMATDAIEIVFGNK